MKRMLVFLLLIPLTALLSFPASGAEAEDVLRQTADPEQGLDPALAEQLGPFDLQQEDFPDRLRSLLTATISNPSALGISEALRSAGLLMAVMLLTALLNAEGTMEQACNAAGCLAAAGICTVQLHGMLRLGTETVTALRTYTGLLLPGLAALMISSGNGAAAHGIYAAATLFFHVLLTLLDRMLIPLIYLFVGLSTAEAVLRQGSLEKLRDFVKWTAVAALKGLLWVFTGFLTLTGLFSGNTDARKLRMTKFAISGMVPVVGGMVSNVSESVLAAAELVKNAAGMYGMLAVCGICLQPFLRIGVQYLAPKLIAAVGSLMGKSGVTELLERFTAAMGMILAVTAVSCVLTLLILAICIRTVRP